MTQEGILLVYLFWLPRKQSSVAWESMALGQIMPFEEPELKKS